MARTLKPSLWPAVAALLAVTPLAAQAGGTNHVAAQDASGTLFDSVATNTPAQAGSAGFGYGGVGHFALADGAALTWRAAAGNNAPGSQDRVLADSQWAVTVLPGSSGLALGTALTLTLQLSLDGTADAGLGGGGFADGWRVWAETTGLAALAIRNPSAPDWDPETQRPLFSFEARAFALVDTASCHQAQPCGGNTYAYTHRVGIVDLQASLPGGASWAWGGNSNSDTTVAAASAPARQSVSFNSGVLSFTLPVAVGDQLLLDGGLDLSFFCLGSEGFGTGVLPCINHADFSNTMRAALVSSVPGIEFDGLTPPLAVPEPPAALLMLAGAVLLSRARGRRPAA
jgi:hypothetical protein